ncbi:hypothetical protein TrVE_jg5063 [Triparma verrucosa]|uniref:Uncharacterized protein n=1 Tax=Triparma verrucosa TaxID=1606542 RepID=A0A9W7B266_9STRA|nr:hypothetical protein TrVE_jg5063 [Triparma verrucosa]
MSNLHKSWESLEKLLPFIDNYETVGIFRNDVIFIDEVDIFSSDFAIPKWGSFKGFNDRMFYGTKENALKWAGRFDRLTEFDGPILKGETYLKWLLRDDSSRIDFVDTCFLRVRVDGRVKENDCKATDKPFDPHGPRVTNDEHVII